MLSIVKRNRFVLIKNWSVSVFLISFFRDTATIVSFWFASYLIALVRFSWSKNSIMVLQDTVVCWSSPLWILPPVVYLLSLSVTCGIYQDTFIHFSCPLSPAGMTYLFILKRYWQYLISWISSPPSQWPLVSPGLLRQVISGADNTLLA